MHVWFWHSTEKTNLSFCLFSITGIFSVEQHTVVRVASFLGHEFPSQDSSGGIHPDRGSMASSPAKLQAAGLSRGLGLGEDGIGGGGHHARCHQTAGAALDGDLRCEERLCADIQSRAPVFQLDGPTRRQGSRSQGSLDSLEGSLDAVLM